MDVKKLSEEEIVGYKTRGRPKSLPDEKKDEKIRISLTSDEMMRCRIKAAKMGMDPKKWILYLVLENIKDE